MGTRKQMSIGQRKVLSLILAMALILLELMAIPRSAGADDNESGSQSGGTIATISAVTLEIEKPVAGADFGEPKITSVTTKKSENDQGTVATGSAINGVLGIETTFYLVGGDSPQEVTEGARQAGYADESTYQVKITLKPKQNYVFEEEQSGEKSCDVTFKINGAEITSGLTQGYSEGNLNLEYRFGKTEKSIGEVALHLDSPPQAGEALCKPIPWKKDGQGPGQVDNNVNYVVNTVTYFYGEETSQTPDDAGTVKAVANQTYRVTIELNVNNSGDNKFVFGREVTKTAKLYIGDNEISNADELKVHYGGINGNDRSKLVLEYTFDATAPTVKPEPTEPQKTEEPTSEPTTKPAETEKPAPTKPAETEKPTPTKPAETEKPVPTKPAETEKPVPTKPAETEKPTPTKPAETEKPTPTKPAETEKPAPTNPAAPIETQEPDVTEQPAPVGQPTVQPAPVRTDAPVPATTRAPSSTATDTAIPTASSTELPTTKPSGIKFVSKVTVVMGNKIKLSKMVLKGNGVKIVIPNASKYKKYFRLNGKKVIETVAKGSLYKDMQTTIKIKVTAKDKATGTVQKTKNVTVNLLIPTPKGISVQYKNDRRYGYHLYYFKYNGLKKNGVTKVEVNCSDPEKAKACKRWLKGPGSNSDSYIAWKKNSVGNKTNTFTIVACYGNHKSIKRVIQVQQSNVKDISKKTSGVTYK